LDTTQIPKSFWHAVSFCMVIVTIGVLVIAYKSSSVSIEIANARIDLTSAISATRGIKSDLENENERLKRANADIKKELKRTSMELVKIIQNPNVEIQTILNSWLLLNPEEELTKTTVNSEFFDQLSRKIEKAENIAMTR